VGSWSSSIEGSKDRSPPAASNSSRQEHGPVVKEAVRKWAELQAGQRILVTTPSVVVGYRCQVYRSEGATQWYTAVIVGHDEDSGVILVFLLFFFFNLILTYLIFFTGANTDG